MSNSAPTADPAAGTYATPPTVTLTQAEGIAIVYTLDGTLPVIDPIAGVDWVQIGSQWWTTAPYSAPSAGLEDLYYYRYSVIAGIDAGLIETGWRLPTQSDLLALSATVGASGGASGGGRKLATVAGWTNGTGLDSYGFHLAPLGYKLDTVAIADGGIGGTFWLSTANGTTGQWFGSVRTPSATFGSISFAYTSGFAGAHTIRLVRDTPPVATVGSLYTSPIQIKPGQTLRAISYDSPILEAYYADAGILQEYPVVYSHSRSFSSPTYTLDTMPNSQMRGY